MPVEFDAETLRYRGGSRERCFELFTRLGFRTLVMEYAPDAQTIGKDYALVRTLDELRELAAALRATGRFGFRVLPDVPSAMRAAIAGLAFSTGPRHARYVPLTRSQPTGDGDLFGSGSPDDGATAPSDVADALAELKGVLEDASIAKVGHDLKFDAIVLERHGVALRGIETDTMLASYLLDATRSAHPLEELALEHAGYKALREEDLCGRGAKAIPFAADSRRGRRSTTPASGRTSRCSCPARCESCCARKSSRAVYHDLELPLIPVLVAIERAGIRVDGPALAAQSQHVERELASRSAQIFELAGEEFNINSPKQLSEILFDKLQLPALKRNAQDEDGVDGRRGARGAGARARSAAPDPRVARAAEAEGHLHRRAAAARQSRHGARPHLLQSGGRGHRPLEQQRSQPAEHPDPHRARPGDPARLHRRSAVTC